MLSLDYNWPTVPYIISCSNLAFFDSFDCLSFTTYNQLLSHFIDLPFVFFLLLNHVLDFLYFQNAYNDVTNKAKCVHYCYLLHQLEKWVALIKKENWALVQN